MWKNSGGPVPQAPSVAPPSTTISSFWLNTRVATRLNLMNARREGHADAHVGLVQPERPTIDTTYQRGSKLQGARQRPHVPSQGVEGRVAGSKQFFGTPVQRKTTVGAVVNKPAVAGGDVVSGGRTELQPFLTGLERTMEHMLPKPEVRAYSASVGEIEGAVNGAQDRRLEQMSGDTESKGYQNMLRDQEFNAAQRAQKPSLELLPRSMRSSFGNSGQKGLRNLEWTTA